MDDKLESMLRRWTHQVILFGSKVYKDFTRGESLSLTEITRLLLKHANGCCQVKTDQLFLVDENKKREFQQGTLRLNIRQNFTSRRTPSRGERLPGKARQWSPVETFRVKLDTCLIIPELFLPQFRRTWEMCHQRGLLWSKGGRKQEVKLPLFNTFNPLV